MAAEAIIRALRGGALEGEHAPALTIKDSIHSPLAPFVFNHILTQLSSNISSSKSLPQGIVLVAFARSPQFYGELLQSEANDAASLFKWLRILDCYTDTLGWKSRLKENGIISNSIVETSATTSLCKNAKDLDKLFSSIIELGKDLIRERKGRFAVAIDSVQFNLQLSEKERNDRAKVVLPFGHQEMANPLKSMMAENLSESKTKNKETTTEKLQLPEDSGSGEIIYFRDSDDEMPDSDEDHDDDLDI